MKAKGIIFVAMIMAICFTGCTHVRTYTVEKERVDQDLGEGNQGIFNGDPNATGGTQERRMTRKTYVMEVELGSTSKKKKQTKTEKAVEAVQEPVNQPMIEETPAGSNAPQAAAKQPVVTSYTVLPNETLQKISLKVFGTSKKWKAIFEANKDSLKSPDHIYAGQVLKIPQE